MELRYNFLLMTWRGLRRQCSSNPSSMSARFMLPFLPSVVTLRSVVPLSYEKNQAGRIAWSRLGVFKWFYELEWKEGTKNISYCYPTLT